MADLGFFDLPDKQEESLQNIIKKIDFWPIIDKFYDFFTSREETAHFFKSSNIEDLKKRQIGHWQNLLNPETREKTYEFSAHIGHLHEKLGVNPRLYLAGYVLLFEELNDQAQRKLGFMTSKNERKAVLGAISKILMADIVASLNAYIEKSDETSVAIAQEMLAGRIMDGAVDAAMAMNHLFVDSLKAAQIAKDVDGRVSSISAAIEQMSASVNSIKQSTQQAQDYTQKTSESAQQGRQISEQAMETMNTIYSAVQDTTGKAHSLSESSERIKGIVTQIQDIAEQTNLLALNATIEAARAGEAGKGFAVVANEVKSLANQTSQSTQEISDIVGELVGSIQAIVGAMNDVGDSVETGKQVTEDVKTRMHEIEAHAEQVSARMQEISSALQEQGQASEEISQASSQILEGSKQNKEMSERNSDLSRTTSEGVSKLIADMSDMMEMTPQVVIKLAKSDHIIWMRKLSDMLMGNLTLGEDELKDHTQCRLGKWYYGPGMQELGQSETFKALEEPHAAVHRLGMEAYELYKNHDREAAFKKLEEMESASQTVIDLLNTLEKQLAQDDREKAA